MAVDSTRQADAIEELIDLVEGKLIQSLPDEYFSGQVRTHKLASEAVLSVLQFQRLPEVLSAGQREC